MAVSEPETNTRSSRSKRSIAERPYPAPVATSIQIPTSASRSSSACHPVGPRRQRQPRARQWGLSRFTQTRPANSTLKKTAQTASSRSSQGCSPASPASVNSAAARQDSATIAATAAFSGDISSPCQPSESSCE